MQMPMGVIQGFGPNFSVTEKAYEYGNLDEETMNRILILENLSPEITKKNIFETLETYAPIENIHLFELRTRKFAFIFMKEVNGALKLLEKSDFKNNPNINLFSHILARDLFNENSQFIHEMIQKLSKPEEFASLLQGDFLEPISHKLASNMPLSFEAHSLMVREVWIGYFPTHFNVEMIRNVL